MDTVYADLKRFQGLNKMIKKKIEKYIPKAIEAIQKKELGILRNNKVPKEYNGYISSFGASIRQAGLLATVLFFDSKNAGSQEDRSKVLRAIELILGIENGKLKDKIADKSIKKQEIQDAAVALKLAIRTFKFEDKQNENG